MAQQAHDKLARSLLDPSGREVNWALVFAGVKNVVKANNLNGDTLICLKGWLKSNDSQLHIPLLGVTVLHTMSLNCGTVVRNQMALPKLFQRLEKQLARPQGPQVATALVQVLVDWAYLFGQEDLGMRSRALLDQPRYRQMALGCNPSQAVLAMQEEQQLGVPPVAPIRGEDFIRWMYRGAAGLNERNQSVQAGTGGVLPVWPSVSSGALPGGAPPPITTHAVPELCQQMQIDAERMKSALAACHAAARVQRQGELSMAMDAAYREAERCSQWRRRAQDYTLHCDDPGCLAPVLTATDQINQALQDWQQFTTRGVFEMLRIVIPPPPPQLSRPRPRPPQTRHQPLLIEPASMLTENPFMASQTPKPLAQDKPATPTLPPGWDPFSVGPPSTTQQAVQGHAVVKLAMSAFPQENGADPRVGGSHPSQTVSPTLSSGSGGRQVDFCGPSATSITANASTSSGAAITGVGMATGMAVHSKGQRTSQWPRFGATTTATTKGLEDFGDLVKAELARTPHPVSRTGPTSPAAPPGGPAMAATGNSGQTSTTSSPNSTMPNGTASPSTMAVSSSGTAAATSSSSAGVCQAIFQTSGTTNSAPMTVAVTPVDRISNKGNISSSDSGMAATTVAFEWLPEFEQLESDLRALWSTSSPAPSPSSSSAMVSASGASSRAGAGSEALLPEVLSRVKGMCEALEAKHARQFMALMSAPPSALLPLCEPLEPVLGAHDQAQLRAVASVSTATSTGVAAAAAVTRGSPRDGNGLPMGTGSWVGFGADTHEPGVGMVPLHQHLMHKEQQLQRPQGIAPQGLQKSSDGSLI
ncbi:hypothetical protein VaNZ11_015848 [Volvox africanus]|uniref:VHS domain-containing protein n=1 Tax=Volvox africanus TaxID=51714 RepID=A0ABQ5SMU7_9CHLO|nr:hypothetical protein VaNZ11_015848 [Volvox africanus]